MGFKGYIRPDESVGCRNHVAVIPMAGCAADVARAICPHVEGTRPILHREGCNTTRDQKLVTDVLTSIGCSGNVGGVLLVALGCESVEPEIIADEIAKTGRPVEILKVYKEGGYAKGVEKGITLAQNIAIKVSKAQREEVDFSKMIIASKCGASDSTSGLAANSAIGLVADRIVDLGGTFLFGETTEMFGAEQFLYERAANVNVEADLRKVITRAEDAFINAGIDLRGAQPGVANMRGGLTTIEEKAMGSVAKSGHRTINGVLEYPERITTQKGVWFKDTAAREPEQLTGMAASGAQLMLFSTGHGAPQGFPTMPAIKVCGNPINAVHLSGDMDFNAGKIITGECSVEQIADEIFEKMIRVLNGEFTKSEVHKYYEAVDIWTRDPIP